MTDPKDPTTTLTAICANCNSPREAAATFCEVCGLDFATGQLPSAPPPAARASGRAVGEWVVVVEVDAAFFATNQADDQTLSPPADAPPREIPLRGDEVLIGRTSVSANVHPDIDLGADPGVSRRHAVLKRKADGSWTVTDQGSTNGTRAQGVVLAADEERPLADGSEIHIGAWTRLTLRRTGG